MLTLLLATTCSRNAHRVTTQTSTCRPALTCSVLPKQVRRLSFFVPSCPDARHRRRNCCNDQSNMGRQSTHVHFARRRPHILQGALACVPPISLPHTLSAVSVTDGFRSIYSAEGVRGLWKGTTLALVGVSNGALQFMAYEEMKRWGFEQKRRQFARAGKTMTPEDDKLVRIHCADAHSFDVSPVPSYTVQHGLYRHVRRKQAVCARDHLSIPSYSFAPTSEVPSLVPLTCLTYACIAQNNAMTHLYPDIPTTIKRTWKGEGIRGFYRGLGTNLVRVLPGTCVTFVVYENLAWLFRTTAIRREQRREPTGPS